MAKKKTTERAISGGIRAVRSASGIVARNAARTIIARGDEAQPLQKRFTSSVKRNLRELISKQFRGRDAPIKIAAAESILNATGGNLTLARRLIRERNEFGRTLAQELNSAKHKLLRRVNRTIDERVRQKGTRGEIAKEVSEIISRNHYAQRVIAWHTARAANEAALAEIQTEGGKQIEIVPSPSHPKRDRCDPHFGVHRLPYPIPPYHPFCTCLIVAV